MNTLEVLHHIKKSFPEILVIGITDNDKPDIDLKIEYPGIAEYVKKPIDLDQLTETIFKILNISVSGQINGIGLASFLQMVEMEEKTCNLKIRHNRNLGYLHFDHGE